MTKQLEQLSSDMLEINHRRHDQMDVFMRWHKELNIISIAIEDSKTGYKTEFVVPNEAAMDAFNHPYVWDPR